MSFISTYLNDFIQAKRKHRDKIVVLESRIAPIDKELEELDDRLRDLEGLAPTWHDNVVAPILAEVRNNGYEIEQLRDVTVLQLPFMLIIPGTATDAPKMLNVLFRLEDKTTGDFFVQVTGYSADQGPVQRVLHSNNSLSTEIILKTIERVAERV